MTEPEAINTAPAPAEWQQGYELAELKRFASLFKERHKPLVHGAFGLIKERDIADALKAGELRWARDSEATKAVGAVAIIKRLTRDSVHHDFTGAAITLPARSAYIRAFACTDVAAGAKLLRSVVGTLWAEIFEEDALARKAVNEAELFYYATKIAAGSEIKGLYWGDTRSDSCESAPYIEPFDMAELATLEILKPDFLSEAEQATILAELEKFAPWAQHYSSYNKRKSWTSFALRGYDMDDPGFIIAPREMSEAWKAANPERMRARVDWTDAIGMFLGTMRVLERIPCKFNRVRFMRLAAEGELTRHADITDRLAGIADGKIARLHIPIKTNPSVRFMGWDARGVKLEKNLPERSLCYLDQRKPHAVRNEDPAVDRIHLVVDAISNPALRSWF